MRISDWSSDVCSSDLLSWLGSGGVFDHLPDDMVRYREDPARLLSASGDRKSEASPVLWHQCAAYDNTHLLWRRWTGRPGGRVGGAHLSNTPSFGFEPLYMCVSRCGNWRLGYHHGRVRLRVC